MRIEPRHIERFDNILCTIANGLWYMIFDRLENYHKLTNLIWVWNGQHKDIAVNPNSYDICGEDIYSEIPHDHSSQKERYDYLTSYTHGKMAALSECGYIPHTDQLIADKVKWLWWLPWWGSSVYNMDKNWKVVLDENNQPTRNPKYFEEDFLSNVLNHDYCITLTDLPWFDEEKSRKYLEKIRGLST